MSALDVLIPADIRFPLERANGVQIVKTAAALARAGVKTSLFVRQTDPRPTEELLGLYGVRPHPGLEVQRLPVLHRQGSFAVPRASFLARTLAALASRRGSVVFTRDLQLADLLLGLGAMAPGPVVYEAHAVESLMYGERGVLYGTGERPNPRKAKRLVKREGRVWARAAALVVTTNGIRTSFEQAYGARARVSVIPNGCDIAEPREFRPWPEQGPPRVVYAGQLYPWKGVDVLVQAMLQVPEARLVILGGIEGEPDTTRVRSLVAGLSLLERTEMPGTLPQPQVAQELEKAAVVTVPFLRSAMTERHTSPIKAFEAMAAGRPIVASDLPSSRELLRHEQNALLVEPGDVAALAAGIRRLLADRCLALRLARAAFEEAPRYSWDARGRGLREVLEGVL